MHNYNGIHTHTGNLFDMYHDVALEFSTENKLCTEEIVNIIVHGCNAQGKMASGFAKELRQRYPGAYESYMEVKETSGLQPGNNVYFLDDEDNILISNSITQKNYGYDGKKYVSYDAIDDCFDKLNTFVQKLGTNVHVHFPMIGSDLGGGDWNVISTIIESKLPNAYKHLYKLN